MIKPLPPAPIAGDNGPACEGGTLILSASTVPDATYLWTGPDSFTSTDQNPIVSTNTTAAMAGTYSVVAIVNGCPGPAGTIDIKVDTHPVLDAIGNRLVDEERPNSFTVTATDSDLPPENLTFSLDPTSISAGMTIDGSTGIFTWTPTELQGGATYPVTITVTDDGPCNLTASETFDIYVNEINDEPVGTDNAVTILEDNDYTFAESDFGFSDPNDVPANLLLAVKITTLPSAGTLNVSGTPVVAGDMVSVADINSGNLKFSPDANANGTPYASFTFQVQDDGGTANGGQDLDQSPNTFTITVTAVNDAPGFTEGADETVLEDAGAQTVPGWATAISAGPADESSQTLTFTVTNDNNGLFSVQPSVAVDGTLTYTPAANTSGSAFVTIFLSDDGGTANGGVDQSVSQTFNINVTSVNDAPSFTEGADETVLEDAGAQTVTGWATAISAGPADESGQTLTFTLSNDNNTLFSVQPAVAADGTLTYTPAADANGSAIVTIYLSDDGGTANGGVDQSADQTFNITVTAVNDAPSFTKGADQTILEDATPQTITGWATSISAGPADESGQILTFILSNDNNVLFSVQPAVAADGTLTYTPAANANGNALVSIYLSDDGGTANGGVDQSASQTFNITVTSANDPPVLAAIGDKNVDEQALLTFTATATDPDLPPQTLTFSLDAASITAGMSITSDGVFTWTPDETQGGATYPVTITVTDNGTNPDNLSDAETFNIVVAEVNVAPVLADVPATVTIPEMVAYSFTATATDEDLTG